MTCTYLNHPQGSPEWCQSRAGLLTASRFKDTLNPKLAPYKNYQLELVAERFTSRPTPVYVNGDMRWGTETEPLARGAYSFFTGKPVQIVGLAISTEIEYFGASLDGLVDDDGSIEIKCPTSKTFMEWVLAGVVPEQHIPQMLAQLAVTGRKWCDFVAFDPRFPEEQDLFIRRFEPHKSAIEDIKKSARKFLAEVAEMERRFLAARMV